MRGRAGGRFRATPYQTEHLVTNFFTFPAIQHPVEVCPLSRGVMLPTEAQPLSNPLQAGLRFLHHPLPAVPSARLAARFPQRGELRAYHVPLVYPHGLGSSSTPGVQRLR